MNDLKTLLKHDVQLMYSMEKQIVEALPAMIAKAENPALKQALEQHLSVTELQRDRIDRIRQLLGADEESVNRYSDFFTTILSGGAKCAGMEGIIDEGQKLMAENLSSDVMDAAIIGACQKIEHYEIACYGTARTFARQLGLNEIAQLLQQTLDEEYQADDLLTNLAEGGINLEAETGSGMDRNTT